MTLWFGPCGYWMHIAVVGFFLVMAIPVRKEKDLEKSRIS